MTEIPPELARRLEIEGAVQPYAAGKTAQLAGVDVLAHEDPTPAQRRSLLRALQSEQRNRRRGASGDAMSAAEAKRNRRRARNLQRG